MHITYYFDVSVFFFQNILKQTIFTAQDLNVSCCCCCLFNFAASVSCPGSYQCGRVGGQYIRQCIFWDNLCDGNPECPGDDDEQQCGELLVYL